MKRLVTLIWILLVGAIFPVQNATAQIPILDIIKAGVKKVIKAIDLQIQRQQNKVIWLQNAQKTLENTMSKTKLGEISDWVEKQRTLYKDYYEELAKVKSLITYYQRIKEITKMQIRMMDEYKEAWYLLRQDKHFTLKEVEHMGAVYMGMIDQSLKNIDQITLVITAFNTTMSDAKRLEIINRSADNIEENYSDLKKFTRQNKMLSLQRSVSEQEASAIRIMYGL